MNEETQEIQNENAEQTPASGFNLGDDSAYGRVAELKKELQSEKVERGRVKAQAARIKELESLVEKLQEKLDESNSSNKDYMEEIPEDVRDSVDPVQVNAIGRMIDKRMAEQSRIRKESDERRSEEQFLESIEQSYPGFLKETNVGGDKYDAWMKFLSSNRTLVMSAYQSRDVAAMRTVINLFFNQLGIQGSTRKMESTPVSTGSNDYLMDFQSGKRSYSLDEYASLLEEAGNKVRSGEISRADYMKVRNELTRARDEGRVN